MTDNDGRCTMRENVTVRDRVRQYVNYSRRVLDILTLPSQVSSLPTFIQLEPTNRCNLKCQMCYSITPFPRQGELTFDIFRKIVDPLFPYLRQVCLQGWGEPFMCRDIFRMIEYLKKRNVYVNSVTNGTLLDRETCRKIIASGLDELSFSLDGTTAETYERIRIGARFEEVKNNIRNLVSLIDGSRNLLVGASTVSMKENMKELPDFPAMLHELGIKYWWCQDVNFHMLNAGFAQKEQALRVLLAGQKNGQGDQIRKYVSDALRAARKYGLPIKTFNKRSIFDRLLILRSRRRCTWPWAYVFVTWDGFISPCQAIPSQYYMGNLQEDSLEKIWRSEKYRDFRRQLKSGDLPAQCNNCSLL